MLCQLCVCLCQYDDCVDLGQWCDVDYCMVVVLQGVYQQCGQWMVVGILVGLFQQCVFEVVVVGMVSVQDWIQQQCIQFEQVGEYGVYVGVWIVLWRWNGY